MDQKMYAVKSAGITFTKKLCTINAAIQKAQKILRIARKEKIKIPPVEIINIKTNKIFIMFQNLSNEKTMGRQRICNT